MQTYFFKFKIHCLNWRTVAKSCLKELKKYQYFYFHCQHYYYYYFYY